MQRIVNELNAFSSTCDVLEEVKDRVIHLVTQDEPALTHNQILTAIREDITPETLYSYEALRGTHTLHRILRDLLSTLGVQYAQHLSTNRIAWGLVGQFFESDEDKEECYGRLRSLARDAPATASTQNRHGTSNNIADAAKVMQAISSKFRMAKDKFEGNLGESYDDVLATYSEICEDLDISPDKSCSICIICLGEKRSGTTVTMWLKWSRFLKKQIF